MTRSATSTLASRGRRAALWLALLGVAALLSWLAIWLADRREVIRERILLQSLGARITVRQDGPAWLGHVADARYAETVTEVVLAFSTHGDDTLAGLSCFDELERLVLYQTEVTDEGLSHVQALRRLRVLNLQRTRVSGAGLAYLVNLPQLEELHVSGIDDASLPSLLSMRNLQILEITDAPALTSDGVLQLTAHPALQRLTLISTGVDRGGIEKLKQDRPSLVVTYVNEY